MTKIYLVRHCEALGNVQKLFQGRIDLDITELGSKQLERLTERFSYIELDAVYTSPLLRARKTAQAVIGKKDLKYISHEGLIELDFGIYEGKDVQTLFERFPDFRDAWTKTPHTFAPEGGEAMTAVYERIWQTVLNIAKDNKNKTIACVSHGGVIRCLLCRILENNIEKLQSVPFSDNTGITLLEFDDDFNCKLIFKNDISHFTEELKKKRAVVIGGKTGQ